jgi:hypothetical protein
MSPIIETTVAEGTPGPRKKIARGVYDFAVDGGAVSTIALMGATNIPSGAIITGGFIEVHTQLTSGGAATIAVQVNAANDILPAVAVASWTTGIKKIIPASAGANDLSAAAVVKTTAARDISIVIAAAALTAGRFSVVLEYTDPLA